MQKKRLITLLFVFFAIASSGIWYFSNVPGEPRHYQPYQEKAVEKQVKSQGAAYHGASEYLHMIQQNPYTGQVSMADIKKSIDQAGNRPMAKKSSHIQWESMGPDNIGGRTRAIVIDNDNPKTLYAGGVSGGLWKSTNRGQSWSNVPYEGADQYKALTIVCMEQASDGTLYFGTGEQGFTTPSAYQEGRGGKTGHIGMGMWKSEDKGETWEHIESTLPGAPMTGDGSPWNNIHELDIDPNNPERILAATDRDLRISEDGGESWQAVGVSNIAMLEVNFSPDGQTVLASDIDGTLYRSTDGGASFQDITNDAGISLQAKRIETAFAPSDPNYIYLSVARGGNQRDLEGIYKSEDNGQNWEKILDQGTIVDPFTRTRSGAGQGVFDNVVAVDPYNKERIFVGGVEFWLYDGQWKKAASEVDVPNNPYYLHVDHHVIEFDTKSNPPVMYNGSDGGVFMSRNFKDNRTPTFKERNLGYTTSQFYAFDAHPNGNIVGGTQDNGTNKRLKEGISGKSYKQVKGGDGFFAEISELRPDVFIVESQQASISRSPDAGASISEPMAVFDCNILVQCEAEGDDADALGNKALFNNPFQLWETDYDTLSNDSVFYTSDTFVRYPQGTVIAPDTIRPGYEQYYQQDTANFEETGDGNYETKTGLANLPGDIVTVVSNNAIEFNDTLHTALGVEEDHLLQDVIKTFFVLPMSGEVWLTKDMLKFGQTPEWFKIADADFNMNTPIDLDFSPDGNHVYVGGYHNGDGKLVRISGLRTARFEYDSTGSFNPDSVGIEVDEIATFNGTITGIDFDDANPDRLLATAGNYGPVDHIFYSENALDSAQNVSFTTLDDAGPSNVNLPQMPVYDGIFLNGSPDTLIVGTEMGVWTHNLNNPSEGWQEINEGMERVPTHMLRQVKWHDWHEKPKVFAATHGRGIFRTGAFHTSIEEDEKEAKAEKSSDEQRVKLFPNPATSQTNIAFELENQSDVQVNVYSVAGDLVEQKSYESQSAGEQQIRLNTSQYKTGQYIIQVDGGAFAETAKLLVQ